jgi:hypothetical protein
VRDDGDFLTRFVFDMEEVIDIWPRPQNPNSRCHCLHPANLMFLVCSGGRNQGHILA